jgi:hypothetical protein
MDGAFQSADPRIPLTNGRRPAAILMTNYDKNIIYFNLPIVRSDCFRGHLAVHVY